MYQHFNAEINPVFQTAPMWVRRHLHINPQTHLCPTFDLVAVVEVDVLEFGFVIQGFEVP